MLQANNNHSQSSTIIIQRANITTTTTSNTKNNNMFSRKRVSNYYSHIVLWYYVVLLLAFSSSSIHRKIIGVVGQEERAAVTAAAASTTTNDNNNPSVADGIANNNNNVNDNNNNNEEYDFIPWVQDHYSDDRVAYHSTHQTDSKSTTSTSTTTNYGSTTISLLCVTVCICTAALAAGLTLGMMSIDPLFLAIKYRSGTDQEKRQASQILPLVKQHHFLLVTLLLMNSLANEALPIFLNDLVPDYVAVLLSVTLVLFFGEIIPSAIFTGPDQMSIAATLVPIVQVVMIVLSPIAYPISILLDKVLHPNNPTTATTSRSHGGGTTSDHDNDEDHALDIVDFNREEIKTLIRIQYEQGLKLSMKEQQQQQTNINNNTMKRSFSLPPLQRHNSLTLPTTTATDTMDATAHRRSSAPHHERVLSNEVELVEGALTLAKQFVRDVCVPLHCVFVLDKHTTLLDMDTMAKIYSCGFSRIPVVITNSTTPQQQQHLSTTDNEHTPLMRATTTTTITNGRTTDSTTVGKISNHIDKASICGVLLTRQLIVINPNDNRPLSEIPLLQPLCVSPDLSILHMLQLFLKSSTHMAIVCQNPEIASLALRLKRPIPHTTAGVIGIITMEDVLEELLKEEIYDEKDIKARNISGQRIYGAIMSSNRLNKNRQRLMMESTEAAGSTRSAPSQSMAIQDSSAPTAVQDSTSNKNPTTTADTNFMPLSKQISNLTDCSEDDPSNRATHIWDHYL